MRFSQRVGREVLMMKEQRDQLYEGWRMRRQNRIHSQSLRLKGFLTWLNRRSSLGDREEEGEKRQVPWKLKQSEARWKEEEEVVRCLHFVRELELSLLVQVLSLFHSKQLKQV